MVIFLACHTMICLNGSLVITCQNEKYDEIIHLEKQVFYPNYVCSELLIHLGRNRYEEEVCQKRSVPETRGDFSIQGLWDIQTEAIIDIRFGNTDAETWNPVIIEKLLVGWEKNKKEKYGQACYDQWIYFPLFLLLADGMISKEALVVLTTLS